MTDQHPITPPPELVSDWRLAPEFCDGKTRLSMITITVDRLQYIATQAARWGADQELEACCEYLTRCAAWEPEDVQEMRDLRRPKLSSLKEEALSLVEQHEDGWRPSPKDWDTIRRALEQLDD